MALTRRQTILGVAFLGAGTGSIAAAGAFDSVDADRQVRVEFADDSAAVLGLTEGRPRDFITVGENNDGTVTIVITDINRNALVRLDDILTITNNGSQTISSVTFEMSIDENNGEIYFQEGQDAISEELSPGQSVEALGFTIDTRESANHFGNPEFDGSITIRTEAN